MQQSQNSFGYLATGLGPNSQVVETQDYVNSLLKLVDGLKDKMKEQLFGQPNHNLVKQVCLKFEIIPSNIIKIMPTDKLKTIVGNTIKSLYLFRDQYNVNCLFLYIGTYSFFNHGTLRTFANKFFSLILGGNIKATLESLQAICKAKNIYSHMLKKAGTESNFILTLMHADDLLMPSLEESKYDNQLLETVKAISKKYQEQIEYQFMFPLENPGLKAHCEMTKEERHQFFRNNDSEKLFDAIRNEVYYSVINSFFPVNEKRVEFDRFNNEFTRCSIQDKDRAKQHGLFLKCIFGYRDNTEIVHPHPLVQVSNLQKELLSSPVLELGLFDPLYSVPVMLVGRWFARVIMQNQENISSNCAQLMLYKQARSGKSLITQAISKFTKGYIWHGTANNKSQDPSVIQASTIILEEKDFAQILKQQELKVLLDYTSALKVEIKYAHPIDVSKFCPVLMTTNSHIYDIILHQQYGGGNRNLGQNTNELIETCTAVKNRCTFVQFNEEFARLHPLPETNELAKHNFQQSFSLASLPAQLFNFFIAFSVLQTNTNNDWALNQELITHVDQLKEKFTMTAFGQMYIKEQKRIDAILDNLEKIHIAAQVNEEQLARQYKKVAEKINDIFKSFMQETIKLIDNSQQLMEIYDNDDLEFFEKKLIILNDANFQLRLRQKFVDFPLTQKWQDYILENTLQFNLNNESYISEFDLFGTINAVYAKGGKSYTGQNNYDPVLDDLILMFNSQVRETEMKKIMDEDEKNEQDLINMINSKLQKRQRKD